MKIAMHVDARSIRGSERQVLLLVRGLIARGHEVVVACRAGSPGVRAFAEAGARTSTVRPRGDVDLITTARFANWLRSERPDALLETSWKRVFSTGLAGRMAGLPRIVLRLGLGHANIGAWKYRQALTRFVDAVYVNSSGLRDLLAQEAPWLSPDRIHVVRNAIEPIAAAPAPIREELSIGAGIPIVAAAGGLERRKGFDVLIDAFAMMRDRETRLVIAGGGPDRPALERQAADRGIAHRVHLIGQRGDVPSILSASDVFVLSSRSEGMAVAMLEAMSAGTPVISSDVHGARDALDPAEGRGAAGWIVPIGDAGALAGSLDELLEARRRDPAALATRVEEARWRVRNWYAPSRMAEEVERLLRSA